MESITYHKQKIRVSVIEYKDICALFGQNGIVSIGIAEELSESLNNEQIDWLIYHLKRLQYENGSQSHE